MKMSNIILLSLIGMGLITSFSFIYSVKQEFKVVDYSVIEGSEKLASKQIQVRDFSEIKAFDQMRVILKEGDYSVEILAEDNILESISVEKQGETLEIRRLFKEDKGFSQKLPMIVKVSAPNITSLKCMDQSEIKLEGVFSSDELNVELGQQSFFVGVVDLQNLKIVCEQQSSAQVQGSCQQLSLNLKDQAGIKAGNLKASEIDVNMSSQTSASLNALESIKGSLHGTANLSLKGQAKENTVTVSKSARMKR